ncbi:putative chromatin binding protein [Leishmania major strain Friedlin]|uniref:Putative chromatin binding protein n=1 Tax=Leishmania major TaxID=5664 RepID=Q4QH38_LEIMA|nr:putative chromatin binding protein [Leishmania major strain Friedlin]CAG9570164.1 chromatin_binding_protein_-_putative [Leishmania major strain Friedlin]CAJ02540.1 putative chromatin binding protein [Leishmania major strain Friedlin]|eukprot:XP_001681510.1 putative chromatin binding protein [Leishmania major strain Friedlin]
MPVDDLTSAPATVAGPVYTAIAVCGCGHDGRLGIGQDAPSAMSEIALLDDFLPTFASASTVGEVRQVACGAYHTLVLTNTGLYGWGLHEDGQLGLGRPSTASTAAAAVDGALGNAGATAASVPTHVDRPVRIPFAECPGGDGVLDDVSAAIISIHCGANHSFLCSTAGVYVTGRNDCGQLGFGHTDNVYTWTRLCAALPQTTADDNARHTTTASRAASPMMSAPPSACDSVLGGRHARLLYGRLTHISCGTHHTLLAWSDAVVLRAAAPSSPASQQSPANSNDSCELVNYPSLLMACGRGDFGELGYNGDTWAVLQAQAQRQERALRSSLQQQQAHDNANEGRHGATDNAYKFKWKAAAAVKQRRPPFNSAFFELVEGVEHLEESAVRLPTTGAEALLPALLHRGCTAHELAEYVIRQCHESTAADRMCLPPTASARQTGSGVQSRWEVAKVQAMHHHSAVTLRRRHDEGGEQQLVLHWGCYYCSDIEDAAASHPRDAFADVPDASHRDDAGAAAAALRGLCVGIHAGEESLLRYRATRTPSVPASAAALARAEDEKSAASPPCGITPPHVPLLQIMGSGNLGLGTDDSFTRTWTSLAFSDAPVATGGQAMVRSVVGRSHYLIWMHDQRASSPTGHSSAAAAPSHERSTVASSSCVFGFGDNLHGQIGAPALQARDVPGDDVVVAPRPVLRDGNVLRVATAVQQTLRDAAAPPARHRRLAAAKTLESFTSGVEAHYEVVAIRAVEAGARHSVFLVDVRPADAAAASAAPATTSS